MRDSLHFSIDKLGLSMIFAKIGKRVHNFFTLSTNVTLYGVNSDQ
jgi:hypothetical protein